MNSEYETPPSRPSYIASLRLTRHTVLCFLYQANSFDPDKLLQNTAFHQHFLQSSGTEIHHDLEISPCNLLKFIWYFVSLLCQWEAQWLSVRLEFETHQRHCAVSLSKPLYPLLRAGSAQEDRKNVPTLLKNC